VSVRLALKEKYLDLNFKNVRSITQIHLVHHSCDARGGKKNRGSRI
jgi:hypothetical protein